MSYQSVIAHQARSPFRAIRADYVAICNGAKDPVCAALLLDLAEAWTNHILDKKEDDTLDGIEFAGDLWFYRSEEKIMGDLFNAYGINKLRDNRRWLVDNGLLECQQIPRTEGGFTNYYRLPIEAIQAKIDALSPVKNNGRSTSKHTLKITDAPVKNNAIREIDKESKEKELSPELQTRIALVKKELKQYGTIAEKIAKLSLCLCTGKEKELNLDTPMTDSDFLAMMSAWDKKKDSNGEKLARPSNLGSFRRNALKWQEENKTKPAASYTPTQAAAVIFDEISDTDTDSALAIIRAKKGELSNGKA